MSKTYVSVGTLALCLMATPVFADGFSDWPEFAPGSETGPKDSEWKGNVQFGYVMSTGNTESENLNGKFLLGSNSNHWRQNFKLEIFSSSEDETTTNERYKFSYQLDRKWENKDYWFTSFIYEDDRFSGYDSRASLTSGYGRRFIEDDEHTWDGEIGIGYRMSEIRNPAPGVDDENEAIIRLASKYNWQIEEDRSLMADFAVEAGQDSTQYNLEVGFITMIAGDISLKAAYEVRYNTDVPGDTRHLDTITTLNLLYKF